jgi:hypothetical protein
LKKRLPVLAETFEDAQARELQILPPTFTEKNLKTKTFKEEEFQAPIDAQKTTQKVANVTSSGTLQRSKQQDSRESLTAASIKSKPKFQQPDTESSQKSTEKSNSDRQSRTESDEFPARGNSEMD